MPATTTTPESLAMRRMHTVVARCKSGVVTPGVALVQIEALAAALPADVYDRAVDDIETIAIACNLGLEPKPHRDASKRQDTRRDGRDAATRRAVRRAQRTHKPAVGRGRYGNVGIESTLAERVTAATDWRVAGPVGEVATLRPVWAVDAHGIATDAALAFGTPFELTRGYTGAAATGRDSRMPYDGVAARAGVRPNRDWRVPSEPAQCTPCYASGRQYGVTVPALSALARRNGATMRAVLAATADVTTTTAATTVASAAARELGQEHG